MANGYSLRNYVVGTGTAVGASAADTPISDTIPMSAEDSKNIRFYLLFSALAETTGISFSLQHKRGDEWVDVGTTATDVVFDNPADGDVTTATEKITMTSHGFETGDKIYYSCDGAGVITGLTSGETYYAIDSGTNDIQVATTRAGAFAGTAIDLTQPSGGDNHFFAKVEYDVTLNIENSTDEGFLPLYPSCRWVANTGTSDVCTVSAVYATRRY